MELGKDDIRNDSNASINSMERSIRQSFSEAALSFRRSLSGGDKEESGRNEEEELQQQWAAIERLPTYDRLRTSLFFQHQHVDDQNSIGKGEGKRKGEKQVWVPVDVGQLRPVEMHHFIETQIKHIEQDNLRLLQKQRSRLDRVNMKQPTIEVRYKNLSVEAECEVVQGTPLPTLWNSLMSMISGVTRLPGLNHRQTTIGILNDVSGVIKPARQVAIEIPYVLFQVVLFMIIAYPAIGFERNAGKFMWFFYGMFCNILYMIYFGMMLTAITPTVELAIILQAVFYNLLNLFSGFVVPRPQIPGWWIWMYYTCPLAWTLNALFTSQYGDVSKVIVIFGEEKSVVQFLEDYFGFRHDRLPLVAVILALYPIIFATLFAYFTGRINFQKR
ncbi:pleiotropic drug resistance protein 3-like protein [Carex littledalei]|uniref:Pleiotropic drug resistance protein 3-like protein n=1 Tax=Carex littledalei TaxID=544730 RepID=A0A833R6J6_9POAL|nr:pleiotropic drug resistance protein 3-like protein [Carex littledalei]